MRTFTAVIDSLERGDEKSERYLLLTEYSKDELHQKFRRRNCFFIRGRPNEDIYTFPGARYRFKVAKTGERTIDEMCKRYDIKPKTNVALELNAANDPPARQHLIELLQECIEEKTFALYAQNQDPFSATYGGITPEEKSYWMKEAIKYAKQSTNFPQVGCVIVKEGIQIAFGYRQRTGRDAGGDVRNIQLFHAEHVALQMLGGTAEDCDMYITMEPCNERIHRPPQQKIESCIDQISRAAPRRVIIGTKEVHQMSKNRALSLLPTQGIRVCFYTEGLERELRALHIDQAASRRLSRGETAQNMFGGFKPTIKEQRERQRKSAEELRESRLERLARKRKKPEEYEEEWD